MNTNYNSNPYTQQVLDKGRDLPKASAPKHTFPLTIGSRTYHTEEQYQEALADFLNGYWFLKCPSSMKQTTMTFTVRFTSNALDSPEYIGPFYSEDDAQDYCDARNGSLSLSGIPSWVACYSVVDWLCNFKSLTLSLILTTMI